MNNAAITILSLSLSGSILALLLYLLKPLLKNRATKSFSYYIWLLVLLRLTIPFGVGISLPDPVIPAETGNIIGAENNTQSSADLGSEPTLPPLGAPNEVGSPVGSGGEGHQIPTTPQVEQPSVQQKNTSLLVWLSTHVLSIWLLGVAISLVWHISAYLYYLRRISRTFIAPHEQDVAVFQDMAGGTSLRFVCSNQTTTPMLVGFLKPTVVLPLLAYSMNGMEQELRNILRHELKHHQRHDIAYKWFALLVTCLHWFNPLVYAVRHEINEACELSCDEGVIRQLTPAQRIGYGNTLLALAAQKRLPAAMMATTLCEGKRQLKERLLSIKGYKRKSNYAVGAMVVLAVLLSGCTAFVAQLEPTEPEQSIPDESQPQTDFRQAEPAKPYTKDGFYLEDRGDGILDVVRHQGGETAVVKTLVRGTDYSEIATISLSEFSNVMGFDGFILKYHGGGSHCLYDYYGDHTGAVYKIANSFGFDDTPDDTILDVDGDGVTELICNVTYGGDGKNCAYVYRIQDGIIYEGNGDDLLDIDYEEFGINSIQSHYDVATDRVVIGCTPKGETEYQTFEYELDLSKLNFKISARPFWLDDPASRYSGTMETADGSRLYEVQVTQNSDHRFGISFSMYQEGDETPLCQFSYELPFHFDDVAIYTDLQMTDVNGDGSDDILFEYGDTDRPKKAICFVYDPKEKNFAFVERLDGLVAPQYVSDGQFIFEEEYNERVNKFKVEGKQLILVGSLTWTHDERGFLFTEQVLMEEKMVTTQENVPKAEIDFGDWNNPDDSRWD